MHTISSQLDIRDRWMGIRQLKQGYQPQPYYRRSREGKHVHYGSRAEATAEYLAKDHWGKKEDYIATVLPTTKIINETLAFKIDDITVEEIQHRIKKFKRRKSPGPDTVPMELFMEMDTDSLKIVCDIVNKMVERRKSSARNTTSQGCIALQKR